MKYTHIFLSLTILFGFVTNWPVYGAENSDDFRNQFLSLSEKLYDEKEGDDAYDALVKLLTKDEDLTIAFLSQCGEEELSDVDLVFPDVAFALKSPKLLECVRQLRAKYPDEIVEDFIILAEQALEEDETLTPEAFEELRKKADRNDPDALYKLAMCYYNGNGVKRSHVVTYKLARKAEKAGFDFAKDLLRLPVIDTMYQAVEGDPLNMYLLGRIYEKGLYGFKQNPEKSRHWYEEAEKAMTPEAMLQIAEWLNSEAEMSEEAEDSQKAIEWYLKAAEAGVAEAQFEYGWRCENLGSRENLKLAHDWYLKAANQGHAEAQYRLGIFYGTGEKGAPWNPTKAFEWYRKAADQGHPIAQHNYGTYIHFPEYGGGLSGGYTEAKKWYQKAADQGFEWAEMKARIPYGAPGFFEEADRIMKEMAEQGVVSAIAHCAWRAETFGQYDEAFKYYLLGEKAGSVSALNGLGNCYRYGWGTPKDKEKAIQYYLKAAEKGSIPALVNLSECYSTGSGVEKDEAAAEEWKTKIKNIGPDAMNVLAFCYLYGGKGVKQSDKKAFEWFTKAAELGHVWAQYELGNCYYNGKGDDQDYKQAVVWYQKAADQGCAAAQNNLGNRYYYGEGVAQDYAKAVELYQKAADQEYAAAQNNLGNCYYDGKGVAQDYAKAVEWHQKAADQGYAAAQNNLGYCYQKGLGVAQDYAKAFELYQKAADQGNAAAQNNLGVCYQDGKGVEQDYAKAVELYQKAADQGYAVAQNNLGYCYLNGLGVKKNREKAIEWYTKAAEQGDAQAKEILEFLKKEQ